MYRSADAAFLPIDSQLQLIFKKLKNVVAYFPGCSLGFNINAKSSQPGELPPELLTAPDVNLSAHPAPIVQSMA